MKVYCLVLFLIFSVTAEASERSQRCKASKPEVTPAADFIVNKNGTVTHKKTGLIWKRCVEGMTGPNCQGKMQKHYGADVFTEGKRFTRFAGKSDWRIPTIEELKSIVESKCKYPALNLDIFPNAPSVQHWSSSFDENSEDTVWVMYVSNGYPVKLRMGVKLALRLVRGGK